MSCENCFNGMAAQGSISTDRLLQISLETVETVLFQSIVPLTPPRIAGTVLMRKSEFS